MNYDVVGNSDGPTLMLIHGFMSSNTQWELNVDGLGQDLRLVLVELMGHGNSPAPVEIEPYERSTVLAALDRIRREVGAEQWWVGGHSLGGATSIRYALDYPERTSGVVFTNTRAAFSTVQASKGVVASVAQAGTDLRSLPFHPIGAKHFPPDLKARMVAIADDMEPHALVNTVSNRTSWSSVQDLHRLAMPVMLINGRYERAFQPHVEDAKNALHHLEVVHLEGGHSVNIEAPDDYNEAVRRFIFSSIESKESI